MTSHLVRQSNNPNLSNKLKQCEGTICFEGDKLMIVMVRLKGKPVDVDTASIYANDGIKR